MARHGAAAGVNPALPYPALEGPGGAIEGGEGEPGIRAGGVPHADVDAGAAEGHGGHDGVVGDVHDAVVVRAAHALPLRGDVVGRDEAARRVGEGLDGVEVENVARGFVRRARGVDGARADDEAAVRVAVAQRGGAVVEVRSGDGLFEGVVGGVGEVKLLVECEKRDEG